MRGLSTWGAVCPLGVFLLAGGASAQLVAPTSGDFGKPNVERANPDVEATADLSLVPTGTDDYEILDNVEGPWIDPVFPSVDPLLLTSTHVYAVNTHGAELVRFPIGSTVADRRIGLPWGPVSVALEAPGTSDLLVSCRGSHGLAFVDADAARTTGFLPLPAEPMDIEVLEELGVAIVACSGADRVVEVDLATRTIVREYRIPSKAPTFLTRGPGSSVLVAPQLSGNNSFVDRAPQAALLAGAERVIDGEGPLVTKGLPDEDLFLVDPVLGRVSAVARDVGTVLFDLERNPATGELWMLGTEALNKDPNKVGEAAIAGDFIENRIAILAPAPVDDEPLPTALQIVDLDVVSSPVGQPYALTFTAAGQGVVTGLLTDNVVVLDPTGAELFALDTSDGMPEGAIPRDVALDANALYVYCWGTNTVEVFSLTSTPSGHVATLDLGFDPSPFARGRELFYDGHNSALQNASCASCHIDGRADFIAWDLSDLVADDKGPMVTQSLVGIDKTPPYHWRGEREGLIDFNGAFVGLMGGVELDETPGGDFSAFADYVLSLQNPANPNQDRRRVLNRELAADVPGEGQGDPIVGQSLFFTAASMANNSSASCQECHTLPTGSNGDTFAASAGDFNPRRTNLDATHFLGGWRKEQPLVDVELADGRTWVSPVLGVGVTHAGNSPSSTLFHLDDFGLPPQQELAIAEFIRQIDQGLAPAVHAAYYLDETTRGEVGPELFGYLLPQAVHRNCGIAVYGEIASGPNAGRGRWFFERSTNRFQPEEAAGVAQRLSWFFDPANLTPGSWFVFVGLPVGSAERFAVDFDEDGLFNGDEMTLGTDPFDADDDGDGWQDGHEVANGSLPNDPASQPVDLTPPTVSNVRVLWSSGNAARIAWETDEPTRYSLELSTDIPDVPPTMPGTPTPTPISTLYPSPGSAQRFKTTHSIVATGLLSGTSGVIDFAYDGHVRAIDRAGNQTLAPLPHFATEPFIRFSAEQVKLERADFENLLPSPTSLSGELVVNVVGKTNGPPHPPREGWIVFTTLRVNDGPPSAAWTTSDGGPTDFTIFGVTPGLPGPFLTAVTDSNGDARVSFDLPGLVVGDEVRAIVEYVLPAPAGWPTNTDVPTLSALWDFAVTPPEARDAKTTF